MKGNHIKTRTLVWERHLNCSVKSPGAPQSGVDGFEVVRRRNYKNIMPKQYIGKGTKKNSGNQKSVRGVETIKTRQELRHGRVV